MTGKPITPDEFRVRMKEIAVQHTIEEGHYEADKLMCSLLETLGYGAGVVIFRNMSRWYS